MTPFKTIRARAEKRKGGPKALQKLLPPKPDAKALAKLGDDRILAEMTKRVFSAGFAWSVIENKWPGFEQAFLEFHHVMPFVDGGAATTATIELRCRAHNAYEADKIFQPMFRD